MNVLYFIIIGELQVHINFLWRNHTLQLNNTRIYTLRLYLHSLYIEMITTWLTVAVNWNTAHSIGKTGAECH